MWVQDKSIRPVRGQKYGSRETAKSMLAFVRPQDIMRRRKRDDKNDTAAIFILWRNAQVTWEEARLTGNVARLINAGVSAHIHGRIPEESDRQLPGGNNRDTRNIRRSEPFQCQGQ